MRSRQCESFLVLTSVSFVGTLELINGFVETAQL